MSKYGVSSGPYFPVFGLNTEIYSVDVRIQSEYRKIRTTENLVFGHFSLSVCFGIFHTISEESCVFWNSQIIERCFLTNLYGSRKKSLRKKY